MRYTVYLFLIVINLLSYTTPPIMYEYCDTQDILLQDLIENIIEYNESYSDNYLLNTTENEIMHLCHRILKENV